MHRSSSTSPVPSRVAAALLAVLFALLALLVALAGLRRHGQESPLAVPLAWACLVQPLAQELVHGQVDVPVLALAVATFAGGAHEHLHSLPLNVGQADA